MKASLTERLLTPVATLLAVLQALLIVTGGAVRVTGSGLGCPTWPECTADSYTPVEGQAEGALHSWIEFGNRLLTFILFFAAVAVVILVIKSGMRALLPLALSQVAGIFGQAILGGITVLTKLNPLSVASHFLLSIVLLAAALSLRQRTVTHKTIPTSPIKVKAHTVLTFLVLLIGTLVTGAGPHAGDTTAPRLNFHIATITAIHGAVVVALIAYSIYLITLQSINRKWLVAFIAVALAQGILGYSQYLLGVPQLLVAAHLAGAALLWVTAWQFRINQKSFA